MSTNTSHPTPPKRRLPRCGCKCTKCGCTGDTKFGRTQFGTLNSWCKDCHRAYIRDAWRRTKMTTKPRLKAGAQPKRTNP